MSRPNLTIRKLKQNQICISIIVPCYNEVESIDIFLKQIIPILTQLKTSLLSKTKKQESELHQQIKKIDIAYEIIFIDDGSTDNTLMKILTQVDNQLIKLISLSRNFGKENALTCGLDYAKGDVVIPIDVDLQDPPELIIDMLHKWFEGYDHVLAVRSSRKSDGFIKRLTSKLFYKIANLLNDIKIPDNAGDFRLLDKKIVQVIKKLPEKNRFMKGIFSYVGFSYYTLYFARKQRVTGKTKWNYWKLWNFGLDGIFSFSSTLLRFWLYIGLTLSIFSLLYGVFTIFKTMILGVDVPGYASLITIILFFNGLIMMQLGIHGEYTARIFTEIKNRPIYIVDKIYNLKKSEEN